MYLARLVRAPSQKLRLLRSFMLFNEGSWTWARRSGDRCDVRTQSISPD
jgi:hypothetical protein